MLTDARPSVHSIKNSAVAMRRNARQGAAAQYTRANVNWRSWPHVLCPLEEERRDRQTVRVNFAGAQGFPTEIELLLLTGEVMTLMSTAVAGFSIWN